MEWIQRNRRQLTSVGSGPITMTGHMGIGIAPRVESQERATSSQQVLRYHRVDIVGDAVELVYLLGKHIVFFFFSCTLENWYNLITLNNIRINLL